MSDQGFTVCPNSAQAKDQFNMFQVDVKQTTPMVWHHILSGITKHDDREPGLDATNREILDLSLIL